MERRQEQVTTWGGIPLSLEAHGRIGSLLQWAWFEFRAAGLRIKRHIENWHEDIRLPAPESRCLGEDDWSTILVQSVSPLWTAQSAAEEKLVAGKVQNLRIASARLNGKIFAAGETFSFWKCVGAPRARRGFVVGRELREGCMIAVVGGGLCQLSNALHLAAGEAGMEILERHAHTRVVPGSIAAAGRDATVFWNYKDLRFRASMPFVLEVTIDSTNLTVRFRAPRSARICGPAHLSKPAMTNLKPAEDCLQCHHHECIHRSSHIGLGR
jgi:hypothetical protein